MNSFLFLSAVTLLCLVGCTATDGGEGDDTAGDSGVGEDCGQAGTKRCVDTSFEECRDGAWALVAECTGDKPACDPDKGCVFCVPNANTCDGDVVVKCNADGTGTSFVETCEEGEKCVDGACSTGGVDCAAMAEANSYLGCEFIAVTTSNAVLSSLFDNDFAIVVGNPAGSFPAEVTVTRGTAVVATETIQPGDTKAIMLPMVLDIKGAAQSVVVADAAYEVKSTVPVVAYQYNPFHFTNGGTTLDSFSYTNDASLLLPVHSLTGNYMAITWPTWGHGEWTWTPFGVQGSWGAFYPSFVAVAAVEDGTSVTIMSSTKTAAGNPAAMEPGETATVTLNRGDVLQLYSLMPPGGTKSLTYCADQGWLEDQDGVCPPKNIVQTCDAFCSVGEGDLSGSTVTATKPVAVFAGHMCTFMPYNSWACDHLEEMMLPLETWGNSVVMTAPLLPEGSGVARANYRVLARKDGTKVTVQPAVIQPTTLAAGQFVEFQTDADFVVEATDQIYVTQTLLGQDEIGSEAGDPAMGSGIPIFQSRGAYAFLVPDSYTANYLNVVAPKGTEVKLDGTAIGPWQNIPPTTYAVARIAVQPGAHQAASTGNVGFAITSYGYASYTSYLYPGGMNLKDFPVQ